MQLNVAWGLTMGNKEILLPELFRTNPEKAICLLIDLYGGAVKTICTHILRGCDENLAEDAVQETFVRLWQSLSTEKITVDNLKAYTYTTARNCAIDTLRDYRQLRSISLQELEYTGIEELTVELADNTENRAEVAEQYKIIHETVGELGEPDRSIFVLKYFYNFTLKEISKKLNLKQDNVESRLRRNKEKLRKKLERKGVFYE